MGTEAPKVGAPSKASPVVSGWRQTIWFLEMSVSRVPLEKISTCFQRPLLNPAAPTTIAADSTTGTGASAVVQGAQAVYSNGLFKTPDPNGRLRHDERFRQNCCRQGRRCSSGSLSPHRSRCGRPISCACASGFRRRSRKARLGTKKITASNGVRV